MKEDIRILAIGAHPDDIEIYMGGTMAKFSEIGAQISYVIATDGRRGNKKDKERSITDKRYCEAKCAAKIIGVEPIFLNYEDGALFYSEEIYQKIIDIIHQIKPLIIFTHNPYDYHADHRVLSRIVYDAASFKVPVIYADSMNGNNFYPEIFIDISKQIEKKKEMIKSFQSQDSDLIDKALVLNSFRSLQSIGRAGGFAETFKLATEYKKNIVIKRIFEII